LHCKSEHRAAVHAHGAASAIWTNTSIHCGRNAATSFCPRAPIADRGARAERRLAGDLRHREPDANHRPADSWRPQSVAGTRRRSSGIRRTPGLNPWDGRSNVQLVPTATRVTESVVAGRGCVRPAPASVSSAQFGNRRRRCPARSRVGSDLDFICSGDCTDDTQLPKVVSKRAHLAPVPRPRVDTTAGDVDRPIHRCHARPAQSSSPVGSSREPGESTPKDPRRCRAASILQCNLLPGVEAIERAPGRCGSCTSSTPRPAAFRNMPWNTHGPLLSEPASRRMGGCIQPRLQDVDEVGADCRQGVYGLGDEAVYSALRRSVAP
jgi:hypothetical protein